MAEFIEILSPSALKDLQTANTEVLTLIKNIDNAGKSMQNIKTPSGSDSAVKNLNAKLIQQEKIYTDLQIKLERYAQAQQQTAIKNNQLEASTIRLNKAKETSIKQLEREQAKLEASTQIYNKVQQKLNALTNEYRNLAVKKELSGKLTDAEAKRYDYLSGRITKYDNTLKAVDASMGKYQRNVGNYASAFNPLSNSINQLTREMPAFANSVQTGFMAISNNLPIFFDAMQQSIAQQKELQAQGQPSKNALQLLAGSFFTLGTALSVGVTLLTLFGPQLVKYIMGTEASEKATLRKKEAIDKAVESEKNYIQSIKDVAGQEIENSQTLLAVAKNLDVKMRDRVKAVDELQSRYPDYLGNLSKEKILAGDTADAELRLTDALIKRGIALAIEDKIQGKYKDLTDIILKQEKQQKLLNDTNKDKANIDENGNIVLKKRTDAETNFLNTKLKGTKALINTYTEEKKLKEDEIKSLYNLFDAYAPYLGAVQEDNNKRSKSKKDKREDVEVLQETSKSYDSLLYKLEKNKSMLEEMQKATSRSSSEWRFYQEAIDKVSRSIDILKNGFPELKESAKAVTDGLELQYKQAEANAKSLADLKKATDEYISSFSSGFLSNAGLGAFDTFFKDIGNGVTEFQQRLESLKQSGADTSQIFALYFESIAESAQQAFNKIIELSNQRFQNELVNLEREKEIAILFAGESASAREEIERQYEARQRDIKNREARAKKGQALFNIAIDIAQGIVSALASGNIPLSIAIGAIGAIQLGLVASQPIPQFATGTDNAPEGFALTQEKGAEIITDKSGKIKTLGNNKGAQMTYLSKGDKVFTAEQSSQLMHNQALNSILTSSGIMPTQILNNSTNVDMSGVINAIENKPSVINQVDQSGFRQLITNGHTTKENMNRRITGTSYGV
jgi:hypothetical protein